MSQVMIILVAECGTYLKMHWSMDVRLWWTLGLTKPAQIYITMLRVTAC